MEKNITLFVFLSVLDVIGRLGVADRQFGALRCDTSGRLLCDAFNCLDDEWRCKIGPADSGRYGSGAGGLLMYLVLLLYKFQKKNDIKKSII